jgi:hypothetical protein
LTRLLNRGVKDEQESREARVLSVEETRVKAKEAADGVIKSRNKALRGKVGFAKLVWKELSMNIDIFE